MFSDRPFGRCLDRRSQPRVGAVRSGSRKPHADAGFCAPDGESVRDFAYGGASGGRVLELPHNGCWAEYDVVIGGGAPLSVRLHPPGGECARLDIRAVQSVAHVPVLVWNGQTQAQCNGTGLVCVTSNLVLPPGEYTIRITSVITSGPTWGNQYIDYLSVGASGLCL
jgi:hypothetical protein